MDMITGEFVSEYVRQIGDDDDSAIDIPVFKSWLDHIVSDSSNEPCEAEVLLEKLLSGPAVTGNYNSDGLILADFDKSGYRALVELIYGEIYAAVCLKDSRYAQEVQLITSNAKLLVGAIAGFIAAKCGAPATMVAALAATTIWLLFKIGRNTFCDYCQSALNFHGKLGD